MRVPPYEISREFPLNCCRTGRIARALASDVVVLTVGQLQSHGGFPTVTSMGIHMRKHQLLVIPGTRSLQHCLGVALVVVGLIVSVSVVVVLPDPRSESVEFDNSMQRFAAHGATGIALLIAGQALQKSAETDVQARLSRLIAADAARVASLKAACPHQPSDCTTANPTLRRTPPIPHTHDRARAIV